MIPQFAHWIGQNPLVIECGSVLMLAPIAYYCSDSLKNPQKYKE